MKMTNQLLWLFCLVFLSVCVSCKDTKTGEDEMWKSKNVKRGKKKRRDPAKEPDVAEFDESGDDEPIEDGDLVLPEEESPNPEEGVPLPDDESAPASAEAVDTGPAGPGEGGMPGEGDEAFEEVETGQPDPAELTLVARVNGEEVHADDALRLLGKVSKTPVSKMQLNKTQVDALIDDKLLQQEAKKQGIVITDEELALGMDKTLEQMRSEMDRIGPRVKRDRDRLLVERLLEKRGVSLVPTDAEFEEQYDSQYFITVWRVDIPLPEEATDEHKKHAMEAADQLLAQAAEDGDLARATKDFAYDGKRLRGRREALNKRDAEKKHLYEAVEALEERALSRPIVTKDAVVVLQVGNIRKPADSLEDMKKKLEPALAWKKREGAKKQMIEALRKEADIQYLGDFPSGPTGPVTAPKGEGRVPIIRAERPVRPRGTR